MPCCIAPVTPYPVRMLTVLRWHTQVDAADAPSDLLIAKGADRPLIEDPHPCANVRGHHTRIFLFVVDMYCH